jgi:tocopherol cyclase
MSFLIPRLRALFNPDQFQGEGKTKRYFEGWYFKVVNHDQSVAYAIIPGVAMDEEGHKQAFIQVLDGKKQTAHYHKFDFESFISSQKTFSISIGKNSFSANHLELDLPGISGRLEFTNLASWPKPWYSPGIMGPFAFVPFMECYHGILSMDHSVEGTLKVEDRNLDFTNGRGYTEKDWGRSFPSAYVWMQSNHFSLPGISVKVSVARIPWVRNSFTGFIAGVWLHDRLIRFTTYNKTSLLKLDIDPLIVEAILENPEYRLAIIAYRESATGLASPIQGMMDGRIEESMTSRLEINLTDRRTGKIILNDTGYNTGLEVAGKISEIVLK